MIKKTDIIIVGTGAAGLFCALNMSDKYNILMITKDKTENSDSYLAQGGISVLKGQDDYDSYFEDTMKAGHYENNKDSVEIMIKSSPDIITDLINLGVDFEHDENGLLYTREGAHSICRILYHDDITGDEITSKLLYQANKRKNITVLEYTSMLDIVEENNQCKGIIMQDDKGNVSFVQSDIVVLATGGLGGIFKHSSNYSHITGDAIAIAMKHNIEIKDMGYIQIHPTTLYTDKPGRSFLISESVRGEGAVLLNANKERFVDELLPRDVVATAIRKQMEIDKKDYVYIFLGHMNQETVKKRFPNIYSKCLEEGYDLTTDCIPVTPAQHYFMGGIKVNSNGHTSMPNLYAVGEVSCNGVHGANRLASNSLLESLVFAKRAAKEINDQNVKSTETSNVEEKINFDEYKDVDKLKNQYKKMILDGIRRADNEFYNKWCNYEN